VTSSTDPAVADRAAARRSHDAPKAEPTASPDIQRHYIGESATAVLAASCFSDRAARRLECWLPTTGDAGSFATWGARLVLGLAPWLTAPLWLIAAPSVPSLTWTFIFTAVTVFILWSTRDTITRLERIEPSIDSMLGGRGRLRGLVETAAPVRSPVLRLLAFAVIASGIAYAIDQPWRGPTDFTWFFAAGWSVFWSFGTNVGTKAGVGEVAAALKSATNLDLLQHAPARTPGIEQLRSLVARLAVRCSLLIALVTIPLGWGTFVMSNEHRASAYVLVAIDLVVLLGLAAWLAWGAFRTDGTLTAIARSARDGTLADLSRLLPRDAYDMVKLDGQRAIEIYEQVATEPLGRVGRKSQLITVAATLVPTIVGLAKAVSSVVH
jgi:hypothetical protein